MPIISETAFIDPTAIICGKVIVEDNAFFTLRRVCSNTCYWAMNEQGEMDVIVIKRDTNIQDGVVIHSKAGAAVTIGERSSIAHRSIIHGPCKVDDDVFIGFNSVVFNAVIGKGCVIRHNCVVDGLDLPESFHVPPMTNIGAGFDLNSISKVPPEYSAFSESVVSANHELVQGYRRIANEL